MSSHRDYDEQSDSRASVIRAREKAVKAHSVVIKFKEMGLPEEMDAELAIFSTDVADVCSESEMISSELDKLVAGSDDWTQIANTMVDIQARVDHLAWHLKSIRRPLNRITTYSYSRS
ncbi:MAG: hypothetical protein VX701_06875 [Chloroflexota bacterium]|nr:hypothetical protein [Chloroflexota bacterium]